MHPANDAQAAGSQCSPHMCVIAWLLTPLIMHAPSGPPGMLQFLLGGAGQPYYAP